VERPEVGGIHKLIGLQLIGLLAELASHGIKQEFA